MGPLIRVFILRFKLKVEILFIHLENWGSKKSNGFIFIFTLSIKYNV